MSKVKQSLIRLARIKFVRDTAILQVGTVVNMAAAILTSMIVFRGLMAEGYGLYKLAVALYGMLLTLNLTGLNLSIGVSLSKALAAADRAEVRDLMAFYVKVAASVAVGGLLLAFALGPTVAVRLYGAPAVGRLARWLTFLLVFDPIHQLLALVLQGKRDMVRLTVLNATLALGGLLLTAAAVLSGHGAEGVVVARILTSALLSTTALLYYRQRYTHIHPALPGLRALLCRVPAVPLRPYIGAGFSIALDKNVASLFTLLPLQILGSLHGEAAAAYLGLAQSAIQLPAALFNAAMRNLGVKLPRDVGHGDYTGLRRNFWRVTAVLSVGAVGIYGLFTLAAPWLIPLLYDDEARPAVPLIGILALCGTIAAVGGSMGALYRALERAHWAMAAKLAALALLAVPGYLLIRAHAAHGAAWAYTALIALSTLLTALLVLPYLNQLTSRDHEHNQDTR